MAERNSSPYDQLCIAGTLTTLTQIAKRESSVRTQSGLLAINHGTPEGIQSAAELAPLIGKSPEWICQNAGVEKRRTSELNDDPAELAAAIARPLIDKHGLPDLVLYAGAMQRQLIPDSSIFVSKALGLDGIPGFTVNATCLSFLTAMQTACSLVDAGSYKRVLICTAEFGTRGRNFSEPESAALIGDAGAAAIIENSPTSHRFVDFSIESWPAAAEYSEVRGGGVMKPPWAPTTEAGDNLFHMNGEALLRFTLPKFFRFLKNFLNQNQLSPEDIAVVVPHQTSASGMRVLEKFGFKKNQVVDILNEYGNCVAASIPLALSIAHHEGRIQPGDFVLLLGTAAGLSIGAALLEW